MKEDHFTVAGLGLIGGSIAAAIRRSGGSVCGFDSSEAHRREAMALGLIDETADSLEAAVAKSGTVILAVPVPAIRELLPEVDRHADPNALVIDCGSVKRPIVAAMAMLPTGERMVGGHPIAGTERSGPAAADPDLLPGRRFALCPSARTTLRTTDRARRFAMRLGMHPVVLDPEDHDRILSRTSHLPQLLSTALALSLETGDTELAGPALRDMTRLATSDPGLWVEVARANRDNIVSALRGFARRVEELTRLLESDDSAGLAEAMRNGATAVVGVQPRVPV